MKHRIPFTLWVVLLVAAIGGLRLRRAEHARAGCHQRLL
jgi:hypothetical protein